MQQLLDDRTVYSSLRQVAIIDGAGPRVREMGLGLIAGYDNSAPYADLTLADK